MIKKPTSERPIPAILRTLQEAARHRARALHETIGIDALFIKGQAHTKRSLRQALSASKPSIIAEVKKASPSKGVFRNEFDPVALVRAYADGGAAALSVVTEPDHFQGDGAWITAMRSQSNLPILRKDFMVDPIQVAESAALGADAVLLIARMLSSDQLSELSEATALAELEILFEAHDLNDLEKITAAGASLVGINARDLDNFTVDLSQFASLYEAIPAGAVAVAESGLSDADQVAELVRIGYQGFLIGESLIRSDDPASLIRRLRGEL